MLEIVSTPQSSPSGSLTLSVCPSVRPSCLPFFLYQLAVCGASPGSPLAALGTTLALGKGATTVSARISMGRGGECAH